VKVFGVKWHWIAGSLFALLFGLLLAIRLDVFQRTAPFLSGQTDTLSGIAASEEQWMAIFQEQRKIGYTHRQMARSDKGYRFEESVLMRINTMGVVQDIRLKTTGDLNRDMTLSAFHFDLQSSLFRFVARGEVSGREATVYYGLPAAEKKMKITLQEPPHLSGSVFDSLRGKRLTTGQETTLYVFDPASMGQRPVRVTVMEDEMITIMAKPQKARKIAVDFMGAQQYAWLDEDGRVLKEKGLLGMTLERVTREQALDGLDLAAGADLTEAASIRSNVVIDDPYTLAKLTLRLKNVNTKNLSLAGGRQRYKDDLLTIEKEALPVTSSQGTSFPNNRLFLQATPFIQSDHPEIRKWVDQIVSPQDSDAAKAEKLVAWVYGNVEKRPVLSIPNALETLTNRVGDCNEHAVLLAALARAAGIPAQIEAGLVYLKGRFYYHAWNTLYVGKWITADAVMGQMPVDVTHIRLVQGEADRQIDLMGVIGQLQLEIVDISK
jgi:hypothetical protein